MQENKSIISKFLAVFLFVVIPLLINAKTIYVSPSGNDKNPGTKARPLATFAKAQTLARQLSKIESIEILFSKGIYYLPQPIQFNTEDSPNRNTSVTYKSETEGGAVLSGGSLLTLTWQRYKDGIYVAYITEPIGIDQLYVNGERQRMARFPNAIGNKNVYDTWDLSHSSTVDPEKDPLTASRISRWKNPEGGFIHAMHNYLWGDMHWVIKGKANDSTLIYEGGWQNNRPSKMHSVYRIVENIFEELDSPGEWFYNAKEKKLYYLPNSNIDLKDAKIEVVRLTNLIEFSGSKEAPVSSVHLDGFTFRHVARTFLENKEPLLRSDWTISRTAAVMYMGAEDCSLSNCEFDQVGGNAILISNYNKRITIDACYIHESGASGIAFVGDPAAVRSPLFQYGDQDFKNIDRTPGPRGDNFPEDCLVVNCLITKTGRDEKQTAPIQISMSHRIRVSHCSIYDVPRAGININEGTFGGHVIEYCDVFNTVLETGDHGSFNSWGRDRFWTPDIKVTIAEVAKDSTIIYWDMLDPSIIRNNRFRCDHGWDIDLDDGSSHYQIYNNVLLNGGLKLREGYHRIVTNNIIINNGLHPHLWYLNSGDVFKNNIVFKTYQPAIMNTAIALDGKWGKELDYNFYVSDQATMDHYRVNGCDIHSVHGDPLFEDPLAGDFRVKENSMALKLGFANFPMNQFGVTKPSFKAIAKTPLIPTISVELLANTSTGEEPSAIWMDMILKQPKGDELSAFGIGADIGGVALTLVSEKSAAYKMGFITGDLIHEINGVKIKTISDLQSYLDQNVKVKHHTIVVTHHQTKKEILIHQSLPVFSKTN